MLEQISACIRKLRSGFLEDQSQHGVPFMKKQSTFRTDARGRRVLQLLALLSIIAAPAQLRAQVAGATLSGTVTDTIGTVIPNAQLSIKNLATGITVAVSANSDGLFSAPNLLPAEYEVVVSAPGFSTLVRSGVTLTVGAQQVLNFTLRVGQVTEKVQVTGEAPSIELASSEISDTVNETRVA